MSSPMVTSLRGGGAAVNALSQSGPPKLVAMADVYQHRLDSTYNAVNLNLCKTTYDDEGKPRTFNLDINVSRSDGPGYYYGPGHGPGPMMRAAPRP